MFRGSSDNRRASLEPTSTVSPVFWGLYCRSGGHVASLASASADRQTLMAATLRRLAPDMSISSSFARTSLLDFSGTNENRAAHIGTGSGGRRSSAISRRMPATRILGMATPATRKGDIIIVTHDLGANPGNASLQDQSRTVAHGKRRPNAAPDGHTPPIRISGIRNGAWLDALGSVDCLLGEDEVLQRICYSHPHGLWRWKLPRVTFAVCRRLAVAAPRDVRPRHLRRSRPDRHAVPRVVGLLPLCLICGWSLRATC